MQYSHRNTAKATALIRQVADAKSLAVSGNNIDDIAALRKSLFLPRYFAFQKRNNLGGYQTCQNLWPIPADQLDRAPAGPKTRLLKSGHNKMRRHLLTRKNVKKYLMLIYSDNRCYFCHQFAEIYLDELLIL